MRKKIRVTKSAKKSGSPKIEIREKSVLPRTDPSILVRMVYSEKIEFCKTCWVT